jgi:hypothetical protein
MSRHASSEVDDAEVRTAISRFLAHLGRVTLGFRAIPVVARNGLETCQTTKISTRCSQDEWELL